jgi:membrane-bound acyltransferase YfiQ involved in biofilm formation
VLAIGALLSFSLMPPTILQAIAKVFPFYASGVFVPVLAARRPEKVKDLILCLVSAFTYGFCLYTGAIGSVATPFIGFLAAVSGITATRFLSRSIDALGAALTVPLAFLGRASMTIYVLHILATVSVRDILLRLGQTQVVEQVTVGVAAGIAIPLLVSAALEKFHASKLFGLPSAAQPGTAPPLLVAKPI